MPIVHEDGDAVAGRDAPRSERRGPDIIAAGGG
jgi:hypothetical protein